MKKVNVRFDFECVDRIAGEIINSNDEWGFRSTILDRKEEYEDRAIVKCYGDGLYEIARA